MTETERGIFIIHDTLFHVLLLVPPFNWTETGRFKRNEQKTEMLQRGKQSEVDEYIEGPSADAQHPYLSYFGQKYELTLTPAVKNNMHAGSWISWLFSNNCMGIRI